MVSTAVCADSKGMDTTTKGREMDLCDRCGRTAVLFHNERTGLSFCEDCDADDDVTAARELYSIAHTPEQFERAGSALSALELLRAAEDASSIICRSCSAAVALPQTDHCHDCTAAAHDYAGSVFAGEYPDGYPHPDHEPRDNDDATLAARDAAEQDAELDELTRDTGMGRPSVYGLDESQDAAMSAATRARTAAAIRSTLTTPLDTLNEDGRANERASEALRLYRFARFTQGMDVAAATGRVAGLLGITNEDAGRLVGIGLAQRDRTRN